MPIIECPSKAVEGPVRGATEGALGLKPESALLNAKRQALEEAADAVFDEVDDEYECAGGCTMLVSAPYRWGVFVEHGPPRRAWWTLWIAYWSEVSVSATCFLKCVHDAD